MVATKKPTISHNYIFTKKTKIYEININSNKLYFIASHLPIDTDMKDLGERYEVVIECADENEQTALLLRLSQDGLKVRAIII
jgi:hypothetical protein